MNGRPMAIEIYGGLDLSVARAIRKAPQDYAPAYAWFMEHEGFVGPRPWREHAPANIDIKLCAQSGIQKPAGHPYAISISTAGNSVYSNDALHHFDDGTWIMEYCAHRLNLGQRDSSVGYNDALRRCLHRGLPVGVFVKERGSDYRCLGLAFVERYDSSSGTFLLHGPVRYAQDDRLSPFSQSEKKWMEDRLESGPKAPDFHADEILDLPIDPLSDDQDERERVLAWIVRRKRQSEFRKRLIDAYGGRCTVTHFDVEPALQAAHISSYLGPKSQSVNNGLLLRADLHILFDNMLISVNPSDFHLAISKQLENSDYSVFADRPLTLPHSKDLYPAEDRLAAHHTAFLRHEADLTSVADAAIR